MPVKVTFKRDKSGTWCSFPKTQPVNSSDSSLRFPVCIRNRHRSSFAAADNHVYRCCKTFQHVCFLPASFCSMYPRISRQSCQRFTDEVSVSEKNVPAPIVMFHYSYGKYSSSVGPHDLYDNLCNGSENVAGNCEAEAQKKPMKGSEGQFVTAMWDSPNHSWEQTYRSHMRSVSAAASAFVWHRETDTDRIYPGH